jgi:hypothetical protein
LLSIPNPIKKKPNFIKKKNIEFYKKGGKNENIIEGLNARLKNLAIIKSKFDIWKKNIFGLF